MPGRERNKMAYTKTVRIELEAATVYRPCIAYVRVSDPGLVQVFVGTGKTARAAIAAARASVRESRI